jgi:hypothetical protein
VLELRGRRLDWIGFGGMSGRIRCMILWLIRIVRLGSLLCWIRYVLYGVIDVHLADNSTDSRAYVVHITYCTKAPMSTSSRVANEIPFFTLKFFLFWENYSNVLSSKFLVYIRKSNLHHLRHDNRHSNLLCKMSYTKRRWNRSGFQQRIMH